MMTTSINIQKFNKSIIDYTIGSPQNEVLLLIQDYKKENNYEDYYSTLTNIGIKVGLGFEIQPYLDKKGKLKGYIPYLIYLQNNLSSGKGGLKKISGLRKNIDECSFYIAKEFVYRLMEVDDLAKTLGIKNSVATS